MSWVGLSAFVYCPILSKEKLMILSEHFARASFSMYSPFLCKWFAYEYRYQISIDTVRKHTKSKQVLPLPNQGDVNTVAIPRTNNKQSLNIEMYLKVCQSSKAFESDLCSDTNFCLEIMQFSSHSMYPQVANLNVPCRKSASYGGIFLKAVFTKLWVYTESAGSVNWRTYHESYISPFSLKSFSRNQFSSHPYELPKLFSSLCLTIPFS